jgi:hypothetical protein
MTPPINPAKPETVSICSFNIEREGEEFVALLAGTFSTEETAKACVAIIQPKLDELVAKLSDEMREAMTFTAESAGTSVHMRLVLPRSIWDAAPDPQKAILASHVKLGVAAAFRSIALAIEAHDLFKIGSLTLSGTVLERPRLQIVPPPDTTA